MKNLFKIDADIFEIYSQIEDNSGEITPELEELLHISESERTTKSEGYVHVIRQLKAKAEFIRTEAKRLTEIARQYESSAEKLSDRLLESVISLGNIKTDFVSISTRKTKSISITDESLLASEFMRVKTEPNKTAIKEALDSGRRVAGALMVENYSLNIR
jgi:seryl-tRNA synthetase